MCHADISRDRSTDFFAEFSTDVVAGDDRAVVLVRGELDLATAPALDQALASCLEQGYPTIDVDLQAVTFMACAGVNVLVEGRRRAATAGLRLAVVQPSSVADRLLTLARVRSLLKHSEPEGSAAIPV